ncbi:MAG TPA: CBS domain-containing protein [Nitrospira sp.]|nr:CBS domain-containing protein [Nitrospira sp.]
MTTNVITVYPDTSIQYIAKRLIENRISAVPVLEMDGRLVGIVSEGDLMRRSESGTERHSSWWLFLLESPEKTARDYVKTHGSRAADVMTRQVITVDENMSLPEVAETLEKNLIKRVPVMSGDKLVGIISRANVIRGLAAQRVATESVTDDRTIKASVEKALSAAGVRRAFLDVTVQGGVVTLWGMVESPAERQAARVAAESAPGATKVQDNLSIMPPIVRPIMWAE